MPNFLSRRIQLVRLNVTSRYLTRTLAIGAVVAALAAVALAGTVYPLATDTRAQATRLVSDAEFSYDVVLGSSISLRFSIDTDIAVDEVQVMMRPIGINAISTYGYADLSRGDRLTATYELPTASPRYFPPGTLFDVQFVLRNGGERVAESPEYRVEYLDDDHDWERISDGNLELIYYGIPSRAMQNLFNATSRNLQRIQPALGVEEHPAVRAMIFPNIEELTRHGPTISQTATDGTFFGGFAYSRYLLTIMASPSANILTHELTHLLHDIALGSPTTVQAPAWLTEGIATYFETGRRQSLPRSYRRAAGGTLIKRFRELSTVPGRRTDIGIFYLQSGDFVGFLAEREGDHSIGRLLSELNDGRRLDDALATVYGGNLDELENMWRAQYGLPSIDVRVPSVLPPQRDFPPTIVGIPTQVFGDVSRSSTGPERDPNEVVPNPARLPTDSQTERPQPQELTPTPGTPEPSEGYITSPIGREFRPNTTMLLVAFLLVLGFGALLFRRLRS